jgi:Cytochrome c554 and c-prime
MKAVETLPFWRGIPAPLLPFLATATGDSVSATCHRAQATRFRGSSMAQALEKVDLSRILEQHPDIQFQEGLYHSRIMRQGGHSILTVTHGSESVTVPLLWAFRRGETYVFEYDGAMYESRVSFYNALGALDHTMGAQGRAPENLAEAAGRRIDTVGARDCFGCHSNGGASKGTLHLADLNPGPGCPSCHGSAQSTPTRCAPVIRWLRNCRTSVRFPPKKCPNFVGRCHRTWPQIMLNKLRGVNTVRFQPHRLANSKCYDANDSRIRSTACHDPHGGTRNQSRKLRTQLRRLPLREVTHEGLRRSQNQCASCHMPKIELPGSHAGFTEHQIRIARAGDPYPN